MSFSFPSQMSNLQKEDQNHLDRELFVSLQNLDARIILNNLLTVQQACNKSHLLILESDNYTYLYYSMSYLQLNLNRIDRRETCEKILQFFTQFLVETIKYCITRNDQDQSCLKYLLFLFFYCIQSCSTPQTKSNNIMNDSKPKQLKSQSLHTCITQFHKKSIQILSLCRELTISSSDPQEPTVNRYCTESLFKLLENKTLLRETQMKNEIYTLLLEFIEHDPQSLLFVQGRVINLIYGDENIVQQLADILYKIYQSDNIQLRSVTIDIINMVGENALNNTQNSETQAIKNVQKFFQILCNYMPKLFYQNLNLFVRFYDSENYVLRNAATSIIAIVLLKHLNPQVFKELDLEVAEQLEEQRQKFQGLLFCNSSIFIQKERMYDKCAFSRSYVITQIKILCDANLIAVDTLIHYFTSVCGRVKDVSSLVRKSTLKLFKSMMKFFLLIYVGEGQNTFLSVNQIDEQIKIYQNDFDEAETGLEEIQDEMMQCEDEHEFENLETEQLVLQDTKLKHKRTQDILISYKQVVMQIKQLIPSLIQLMASRSITDIKKAVSLITFMHRYNIEGTEQGIKKMAMLVWHNDKSIVEHMLQKYYKLYLDYNQIGVERVIQNLITLVSNSSSREQISLEQMLHLFITQKDKIQDKLLELIWDRFLITFRQNDVDQVVTLSFIIKIIFVARPTLLDFTKTEVLAQILNHYKKTSINWAVTIKIAQIMGKVGQGSVMKDFFKHLVYLLWQNFGSEDQLWFSACQEVFRLSSSISSPEMLYKYILVKMTKRLLVCLGSKSTNKQVIQAPEECSFLASESKTQHTPTSQASMIKTQNQTSQLLFTIGEITLKILIHIYDIEGQLKFLKNEAEKKFENNMQDNPAEAELSKIQGGFEAEFEHNNIRLQSIAEENTVFGEFLIQYHPFIMDTIKPLLQNDDVYFNEFKNLNSQNMAVLTFCKFMCLSEKYCQQNIEVLFSLLGAQGVDSTIKNNIMVTLGDLLHRWPNTVTRYSKLLFQNLSDSEYTVKKTTLNVLTHLVLNDMLKIKTEISDVGVLLSDQDTRISQLAKLFFHELNKKDNKLIYNILPEAIYKLSLHNTPEQLQAFIQFTVQYIDKDKNLDAITDKLIKRLKEDISIEETRNISYTLTQFNIKELTFRQIIENFSCYELRLGDDYVKQQFIAVGKKFFKRSHQNQEAKALLEEYDNLIQFGNEIRRQPRRNKKSSLSIGDETPAKSQRRSFRGSSNRVILDDSDE